MLRWLLVTLISSLLLLLPAPLLGIAAPGQARLAIASLAQEDGSLADASAAVREFSLLESQRDFATLYERMHPDARAIVPRSVVEGWYAAFFANRDAQEAQITDAQVEPWTWGVTGTAYDDAVTVRFVQPYVVDGVAEDVVGEVHVVPYDNGQWGWFFGASEAFLQDQIALYGDDGSATMFSLEQETDPVLSLPREVRFPDPLVAHIDAFWARRFAEANQEYAPPTAVVPFAEPIITACGRADPSKEAAFYCVIDEKIYYSVEFRELIESRIGDFAWIIVIAHEWGHHVQAQLGFDLGVSLDLSADTSPIEFEQQADCLAGAYSVDAEMLGWLDPGDVDEALYMTEISGDPAGTSWSDPDAHGSGADRIDAFLTGYSGGIGACNLDLTQQLASS